MPPHEYYTQLIVTAFVMCIMAIFVIGSTILIGACRICEHTHTAILFAIWSVVLTPSAYACSQRENNISEKLLQAERKRQRLPSTNEDKQKEIEWLSSLSMTQRLIAIRLLSVNVDDIHDSDKHFLQQVALLPGNGPKHVCRRKTICSKHLRRICRGESRFAGHEHPLMPWLLAFFQSALGFVLFRGFIALVTLTGILDAESSHLKSIFELPATCCSSSRPRTHHDMRFLSVTFGSVSRQTPTSIPAPKDSVQ